MEPTVTPYPIKAPSGMPAITWNNITVGEEYTCGTTVTGKNFCWERNNSYQIGNNTNRDQYLATLISHD